MKEEEARNVTFSDINIQYKGLFVTYERDYISTYKLDIPPRYKT